MMENVTLQDLGIGYLSKDDTKWVAQHLNGVIHGGELTCLLGRNGIGKSTLLRTLSAFQPALEGEVLMGDTPLTACSDKELSQRIGVVLTEKPDVRNMTVAEMVGMGRSPYTGFWGTLSENDRQIVDEALLLVGIGELRGRMIHTLSDGERQKVMIAKALAQQTSVIYLDEPTAFLDFPSKVETIFLSTHDVELSLQLADTIWLMEPNCLHIGTPQQLALEGVLGTFIERESVTFDPQTLTIHVAR